MQGFKSFVDLTHLIFQTDRCAIVGPNGCGKSNVIDAIRWVMGETSAKFLRGDLMSDVIFNGSLVRKASGQASVEIILDNHQAYLQGAYVAKADLALRREINRAGDSSYFINGKKVRRKDLNDLWLGTGAGSRGYAIIGQNMVHHLVEANPEVLRGYLEEAAGVSKYKERRRESSDRLLHVEENMARIRDIILELEQGILRLEGEAKDAKAYHQIRQQLREYQDLALIAQARTLVAKQENLILKQAEFLGHEQSIQENLRREQDHFQQIETSLQQIQVDLQSFEQDLFKQTLELEQAEKNYLERQQESKNKQIEFTRLEQKQVDINAQLLQAKEHLSKQIGMIAQLSQEQQSIELQSQDGQIKLKGVQERLAGLQRDRHLQRQKQQQTQTQLQILQAKKQNIHENYTQAQEQIQKWKQQLSAKNHISLQHEIDEFAKELGVQAETAKAMVEELSQLKLQLEQSKQEQTHCKTQEDIALRNYHQCSQSYAKEQASYQGLLAGLGGVTEDQELHSQWLRVDTWLKSWKIPKPWEAMINWVWQRFIPAWLGNGEGLSDLPFGYSAQLQPFISAPPEFPLVSLLTYMGLDSYPSGFMPWPMIFLAESREQAWALRSKLSGTLSIMTSDGLWLGADWSLLACLEQQGLASQLQILSHLESELEKFTDVMTSCQELSKQASEKYQVVDAKYQSLKNQSQDFDLNLRRANHEQEHRITQFKLIEHEHKRLKLELEGAEQKYAHFLEQLKHQDQDSEKLNAELMQSEDRLQELNLMIQMEQQSLEHHEQGYRSLQAKLNELQLTLARLRTEEIFLQQNIPNLEKQKQDLECRVQELILFLKQHAFLPNELDLDFSAKKSLLSQSAKDLELKRQIILEKKETRVAAQEKIEKIQQEQLKNLEKKWRIEAELEQINEKIHTLKIELNTDFSPSLWQNLSVEQNETFFNQKVTDLNEKLAALGDVNLLAIGLYEQEQARYQQLLNQEQDLKNAMLELQTAIATLDQDMQERLRETLGAINQHLLSIFPQLFGGGEAKFVASCDNLLEATVAVDVQLPGKKQHRIQLLSGGEKALTAIALLFAIFALNPAPFCLLDEVDAALDDANVLRLAGLIKTMSKTVQFVLITHNPLTMNVAEELIGVTMQEPGVSRVVSVNVTTALAMVNKE